jgi:hypothetical protein
MCRSVSPETNGCEVTAHCHSTWRVSSDDDDPADEPAPVMTYSPGDRVDISRSSFRSVQGPTRTPRRCWTGTRAVVLCSRRRERNCSLTRRSLLVSAGMKIARLLDHPGLVRSLDSGERRSEPYLVLEFIDGENFRRHLSSLDGPVPVTTALG